MSVWRQMQNDDKDKEKERNIHHNRSRIHKYIVDNPGCHLRKISKELKLAMGDTQYHLRILEKTSLIKSRRIRFFRMYYDASVLGERQEFILAMLGQEVPRDIILFLLESPGSTQGEIARHKGFSAPTINWHMSRLIEVGLIQSNKQGKFVNYHVVGDVRDFTSILRVYYPTLWSKLSNRLAELFLDISSASLSQSHDKSDTKEIDIKDKQEREEQNSEY